MSKSAFSIFAADGGRQHALAEKKKRHRGKFDAFGSESPPSEIENDERYTTRETLVWCMKKAGVTDFTLDAAACAESHHASCYFTKEQNGLLHPWFGRTWVNPPYSDIAPWVAKARDSINATGGADLVAMLLPAIKTEQPWWQRDVEPFRDRADGLLRTHFLPGRTAFARPGSGGVGQSGAPFGCCLLVFKRSP